MLVSLTLAAGALLWSPLLWGVVLAELAFCLVRKIAAGSFTRRSPADLSLLGLAVLLVVTFWLTAPAGRDLQQAARLAAGLALFTASLNWTAWKPRVRLVHLALMMAGLLLALSAGWMVNWATEKVPLPGFLYERFFVLVSDDVNPNVLAGSLVLLLPFSLAALWLGWKPTSWWEKALALASGACMLAVLLLTQARGAWLAAGLSLLLVIALRWRWGVPVLAASLAAGLAVLLLSRQSLPSAFLLGGLQGVVNSRIEIWARAIFLLEQFPFTGSGMGAFAPLTSLYYPFDPSPAGQAALASRIPHAHNLFLQVGLDLGLPGLIAWLATWLTVWGASWQVYRYGRIQGQSLYTALGAAFLASQLALGVHGITDAVTWGMVRVAPLVWLLWGIVVGIFIHTQAQPPGFAAGEKIRTREVHT
jgi:putative inorganic carbon (HCO3(-)) transporter